jgi:RNA polymerase sigma-70 factor (ECF subfamily)
MTTGLGSVSPPSHVSPPQVARTLFAHEDLSTFLRVRSRLFGVAYRMLGNPAEAEDIVQDVWVRWQTTDRGVVRDPAAFLARTAARLAINVIQSARSRREVPVGSWLAEPVDTSADPALGAEQGEALGFALLLLLEKLSPAERAAYVLREAFHYPYREIADILRIESANARQLVTRARQHVSDRRRAPVSPVQHRRLLGAFTAAARRGDLGGLETLFGSDALPDPPCRLAHPRRADTSQRATVSGQWVVGAGHCRRTTGILRPELT